MKRLTRLMTTYLLCVSFLMLATPCYAFLDALFLPPNEIKARVIDIIDWPHPEQGRVKVRSLHRNDRFALSIETGAGVDGGVQLYQYNIDIKASRQDLISFLENTMNGKQNPPKAQSLIPTQSLSREGHVAKGYNFSDHVIVEIQEFEFPSCFAASFKHKDCTKLIKFLRGAS